MSTTVVGATILCALLTAGAKALRPDEPAKGANGEDAVADLQLVPRAVSADVSEISVDASQTQKKESLELGPLKQAANVTKLMEAAAQSACCCVTEGRYDLADNILKCTDCGHTCSMKEANPPRKFEEHSYQPHTVERMLPKQFERLLRAALPMRIELSGFEMFAKDAEESGKTTATLLEDWEAAVRQV